LKNKYESEQDVKREAIRIVKSVVYSEDAWKKMIEDLFTKYIQLQKNSWYVQNYKLWQRPWDNAEKILVKII
jgi:ribosomal protein L17